MGACAFGGRQRGAEERDDDDPRPAGRRRSETESRREREKTDEPYRPSRDLDDEIPF